MNKKRIIELLGEVEESYIKEAEPMTEKRKKLRWTTVAACICMMVIGTVILGGMLSFPPYDGDNAPGDIVPLIYVEDSLYRVSKNQKIYDKEMVKDFDLVYLGKIKGVVGRNEVPAEELYSNEAIVGSKVYRYNDEIIVEINGNYCVYVILEE